MPYKHFIAGLFLILAMPANANAHEYWLEPERYLLPAPGTGETENAEKLTGNLKNGQNFKSSNHTYIANRFEMFKITGPDGERDVTGRNGDSPALNMSVAKPGLYTVSYQGKFDKITFRNREKIEQYINDEGFKGVLERHAERGLQPDKFEEKYARCAKALIQVGEPEASGRMDALTGMKFELVAEKNPYRMTAGETLPVRLYWEGEPMADVQVKTFRYDGELDIYTTRTDADGRAMIPLKSGGKFLLNAVHLYEGDDDPDNDTPEWFSYWASMVFGMANTDSILKNAKAN